MLNKPFYKITAMILMAAIIISFSDNPEEKEYTVRLTLPEWIAITSHPDDVSKNYREKIIQKIGSQLQPQLKTEDSLFKLKALQDSIKNKKN